MSRWTHAACLACYEKLHPGRTPVRLVPPVKERCCLCGAAAGEGIYIRADPSATLCQGTHPDDDDEPPAREPTEQEWNAWKAAVEAWHADPANAPRHEPYEVCDCLIGPQQPWNNRVSYHCAAGGPVATWAEVQERRR